MATGKEKKERLETDLPPESKLLALGNQELIQDRFHLGQNVVDVWTAPSGSKINPTLRENGNRNYLPPVGKPEYSHFVEMHTTLADRAMSGSTVPLSDRWQPQTEQSVPQDRPQLPPNVEVLDFDTEEETVFSGIFNAIESFDAEVGLMGYLDPELCDTYAHLDSFIAQAQLPAEGVKDWKAVAILRAGLPATMAAGFEEVNILKLVGKRLNYSRDHDQLGIGLDIDGATLAQFKDQKIYIRERAIASMSSILALLMVAVSTGNVPKEIMLACTVGSQRAIELLLEFENVLRQSGCQLSVKIGRLNYVLTGGEHPFYLVSPRGHYQVCDGGDYGDIMLSPEYRNVWPGWLKAEQLTILADQDQTLVEGLTEGQELTVGLAIELSKKLQRVKPTATQFTFGELMTGKKYQLLQYQATE